MQKIMRATMAASLVALPLSALAYVGPGLGAGALAAVLGVLAGIFLLVIGIVWYPLKMLYKRVRERLRK